MKTALVAFCLLLFISAASRAADKDKADLDGELVYRNNCTRCHMMIHTFPVPMLATVTRHMHVRATLTDAETEAVLKYLEESSPQKMPKARQQHKVPRNDASHSNAK